MFGMFFHLSSLAVAAGCFLPALAVCASAAVASSSGATNGPSQSEIAPLSLAGFLGAAFVFWVLRRVRPRLEQEGRRQEEFLDSLTDRRAGWGILLSAGAGLLLELAVIRWQSSVFQVFSFNKNLGLLAAFAGLGLGYANSQRRCIPLLTAVPLLGWQIALFTALHDGAGESRLVGLNRNLVSQDHRMGADHVEWLIERIADHWLLGTAFLLTALAFLPIGQVCGRLMDRRPALTSYGWNLLGSMVGVGLMILASWAWTPPHVWFAVGFLGVAALSVRSTLSITANLCGGAVALAALLAPSSSGRLFSPYQLIEYGRGDDGAVRILASGVYFQRVHDLSDSSLKESPDPVRLQTAAYYNLPYKFVRPLDVAIVGAGTGNDVAAALRNGARSVDAVEIDPAIVELGKVFHPEKPYDDPRVRIVVDDARSFLRNADKRYDLIVYGLLDSHTALSHASSVRLDSFVYTVEGLREARSRLKPGGALALSFSISSTPLAKKFHKMAMEAFDGRSPICIYAHYDRSLLFFQKEGESVSPSKESLDAHQFVNVSEALHRADIPTDVSTDDWPFVYMPARVYPTGYLSTAALVLVLSIAMTLTLAPQRPSSDDVPFFLLGAGFMLVETKAITELGLSFGNTWYVAAITILGVLAFSFAGNLFVARRSIRNPTAAYLLLLSSLLIGLWVKLKIGFEPTLVGKATALVTLTGPVLFAGVVFSTLLAGRTHAARAMAANLFGAICGGLLEYNAMYFGFSFLYGLAGVLYGAALLFHLTRPGAQTAAAGFIPPRGTS